MMENAMKRATRRGIGAQRRPAHPLSSLQHCLPNGILPLRPSPMKMATFRGLWRAAPPPGRRGGGGGRRGARGGAGGAGGHAAPPGGARPGKIRKFSRQERKNFLKMQGPAMEEEPNPEVEMPLYNPAAVRAMLDVFAEDPPELEV